MSGAVPIRDAARALGVPPITLRHWIAAGAPVARRGGRGRGNCTLIDVEAVRAWRSADCEQQLLLALAAELPEVLAVAAEDALRTIEGGPKGRAAATLAAGWYVGALATVDHLRQRCPTIPEIAAIPAAIERLRAIAGR